MKQSVSCSFIRQNTKFHNGQKHGILCFVINLTIGGNCLLLGMLALLLHFIPGSKYLPSAKKVNF